MLQERQYVIRVSALLDRSTAAAVGDAVQQIERQRRTASERTAREHARAHEAALRHVAAIKDRYFRDQQRAEEKAERDRQRGIDRFAAAEERQARQERRQKEATAAAAARAHERAVEHVARVKDRHLREEQRKEEQAQAYVARIKERYFREEQRRGEQRDRRLVRERAERAETVKRVASDAFGTAAAIGRRAVGVAGDVASGLGLDFSISRGVSRAVELEQLAVGIVNAGNRGEGTAAQRDAQVQTLQKQARDIGNKFAFDPGAMLRGLAQFQAKTGDTKTAEAGLERFAKLAKAFNVELSDMISAAGEISSKLEDSFAPGEERAKKTYEVLKLLTAQGQEGAIEIADLAKETARIGGGAGFFKGDIGSTIGKLGAFAQLARQTGGANSPADAARAVAAFVTTLKTPARRAAFDKHKVDYKAEDGSFLDPLTIVKNALAATDGDVEKMNEMFKSSLGTKPVDALARAYRAGGGGKGGLKAVDDLFAKFTRTADESVINENTARAVGSRGSQSQLAQNEIDQIYADMVRELVPALKELVPVARDVTKAFAGVVSWAANNPGLAITTAIVGSIAKAGIGAAASAAITKAFEGGAIGQALSGGLMKGLGAAGAIAGVTIIATTAYLAAKDYVDKAENIERDVKKDIEVTAPALLAKAQKQIDETGTIDKGTLDQIAKLRAELEGMRGSTAEQAYLTENKLSYARILAAKMFGEQGEADALAEQEGRLQYGAQNKEQIEALAAKMDGVIAALKGGIKVTGNVTVDNMASPTGSPSGRTGVHD